MSKQALVLASALAALACSPRAPASTPHLAAPSEADLPFSFDKPPILGVARAERLAATQRTRAPVQVEEDSDVHEGEELDAEAGITREVTVRKHGLATEEDLAGYLVRSWDKTPDDLHPTRALAQFRGPVRSVPADDRAEAREARQLARTVVTYARSGLKRCYAEHLARDPRIIVKAPVGLVWEQAHRLDASKIKLDIDLRVAGDTVAVTGVHARNEMLYDEDVACVQAAVGGVDALAAGIDTQVNLVLFTQAAYNPEGPSPASGVSLAAAVFGRLELQRDQGEEALRLFEDAAWLYRLPEYQVLVGMAHERLGNRHAAKQAYRAYLDGRPGASDAKEIETRIGRLAS
jgi:hypothetical protein